ncbi:hypothetical protein AK830_g12134 [Neonectria ditissima]|uniref:Uncharacterized protein n=1 Tax=Neonectria ditissima TaxID=78410 RepID=A0A0P7B3W5_9HYPO|nr:hypothetical protein AK830_g12134 [Neonectria ditissima]
MSGINDAYAPEATQVVENEYNFGDPEKGVEKEWDYESAMNRLLLEFRLNGLKMCDAGVIADENQPLNELYTATARVLLDHFYPISPGTGKRKLRDDSKGKSEAIFIQQARNTTTRAATAYYNDGYVIDHGQRKHYLTMIPPHHVILAIRFVNPYGKVDDSIAGCLASLGKAHLMEVTGGLGRWSKTGLASIDVQSIATTAVTTAANAQNLVTELATQLGQRIDDLEDHAAGNEQENLDTLSDNLNAKMLNDNNTFDQIHEALVDMGAECEHTNASLNITIARVEALENAQAKSDQASNNQFNSVFNAIKPRIQSLVEAAILTAMAQETTPVSTGTQCQTSQTNRMTSRPPSAVGSLFSELGRQSNKRSATPESSAGTTKKPRYFQR